MESRIMDIFDGKKHIGFWDCTRKDGFGKASFIPNFDTDFDQVECCYDHGYPKNQGFGRVKFKDSRTYEGELMDGKCHGQGILKAKNRSFLQGEWSANKLVHGFIFSRDGSRPVQFQRKGKTNDTVKSISMQIGNVLELKKDKLERLEQDILLLNRIWHQDLQLTSKLRYHTILELPSWIEKSIESRESVGLLASITKSNLSPRSEPWSIVCGQIVMVWSEDHSRCSAATLATIEPFGDGPRRRFLTGPPPPLAQRPPEAKKLPWLSEGESHPFYLLVKIIPVMRQKSSAAPAMPGPKRRRISEQEHGVPSDRGSPCTDTGAEVRGKLRKVRDKDKEANHAEVAEGAAYSGHRARRAATYGGGSQGSCGHRHQQLQSVGPSENQQSLSTDKAAEPQSDDRRGSSHRFFSNHNVSGLQLASSAHGTPNIVQTPCVNDCDQESFGGSDSFRACPKRLDFESDAWTVLAVAKQRLEAAIPRRPICDLSQ